MIAIHQKLAVTFAAWKHPAEPGVSRLLTLSIDLGGSHVAVAVIQDGTILAESTVATTAMLLSTMLPAIAAMGRDCLARADVAVAAPQGVALGFPGVVDGETGEILSTLDKYIDAPTLNLQEWSWREFSAPLRMENDAALALLGECFAGAARHYCDVVMVTLGTGIGGAAMLGGQLLRSRAGQAGCLGGHLPVNYSGRLCSCGGIGCAEAEASTAVLPLLAREHPAFERSALARERVLNFEVLFREVDAGDAVANDMLAHCIKVWSVLTVGLVHAYGPELILFGGGVLQRGETLLSPIRKYVEAHVWRTSRGLPRVERALLGERAALLGGAALFSPSPQATPASKIGAVSHV